MRDRGWLGVNKSCRQRSSTGPQVEYSVEPVGEDAVGGEIEIRDDISLVSVFREDGSNGGFFDSLTSYGTEVWA